jgi:riboflavin biosynthesis pyrimidine reductase
VDPLITLFDDSPPPAAPILVPDLLALYGGDLVMPIDLPLPPSDGDQGRAYCYANFVATIDGVVSFNLPNQDTGNEISGGSAIDHAVMGILRARADAVIWGGKTYHAARRFVPTPAAIWPAGAAALRAQRDRSGQGAAPPIAVVVSATGQIDLTGALFQQPEQPAIIATTDAGAAWLHTLATTPNTAVWNFGASVPPADVLRRLHAERGVRLALCEGGPTLLGAFLAAGALDELFLTRAPQFAGRSLTAPRPGLVEGVAFTPATAPWATLRSLKRGGNYLFERYILAPRP